MSKSYFDCPYCKGRHRTKKAFNQCKARHSRPKSTKGAWTKDGSKKYYSRY